MRTQISIMAATLLAALMSATQPASAQHGGGMGHGGHGGPGGPGGIALEMLAALGGKAREVNREAMQSYRALPRHGTCEERRAHMRALLPDALRFGRFASDVYERTTDLDMAAHALTTKQLGADRTAYYDPNGKRYAEVSFDRERQLYVIGFRGTRLSVGGDLTTNVLNFVGLDAPYYDWAAKLVGTVVREHPGAAVVVTGHSLGGGLAIFSVLRNPQVKGFVFNPSGLSAAVWHAVSPAERARANAAITAFATRNFFSIEPVTALSLAGRSVLPGHVVVISSGILRPAKLHGMNALIPALEQASAHDLDGTACEGDLGVIAE